MTILESIFHLNFRFQSNFSSNCTFQDIQGGSEQASVTRGRASGLQCKYIPEIVINNVTNTTYCLFNASLYARPQNGYHTHFMVNLHTKISMQALLCRHYFVGIITLCYITLLCNYYILHYYVDIITLLCRHYQPHFTDKNTEAQKGQGVYSGKNQDSSLFDRVSLENCLSCLLV